MNHLHGLNEPNNIMNNLDDLLLLYLLDLSIFDKISDKDLLEPIQRVGILFYETK